MAQQNIATTCSPQICQLILVVHSDIASIAIFTMIMTPVHNVLFVQLLLDPVQYCPVYDTEGDNRIPMYLDRDWGIKRRNPVVAAGG